jgi:hypothetical protein
VGKRADEPPAFELHELEIRVRYCAAERVDIAD